MKICLVGYGISNRELLKKLINTNNELAVSQNRPFDQEDIIFFKTNKIQYETQHGELLKSCDLAIVSPGITPQSEAAKIIFNNNINYTTEIEFAWEKIKTINKKSLFVGITGTDGKSTTTSLIGHILSYLDPLTFVGGNIGKPLIQAEENLNYYVIEISSFQIFWSKILSPEISVLINLAPDHLNWHENIEDYYLTKEALLKRTLKVAGIAVINEESLKLLNFEKYQRKSSLITFSENMFKNNTVSYLDKKIKVKNKLFDLNIFKEDLVAAVVTTLNLGVSEKLIEDAIASYSSLKYRLQLVTTKNGVNYYNDSKATNSHAAYNAYKSFRGKNYIAILSGIPKNEDLTLLIDELKNHAKKILVFGEMQKEIIKYHLNDKFIFKNNLEEVFLYIFEIAQEGDNVVFSPGGASFDMYKNYEDRGEHFNRLIGLI
ncbi:hypothetical protein PW5551_09470 [Petrotoga sp. 9PW.55.5.1]|uniref:UDP-N-acetylmuramoyl-L-alanine--D-glutamate ligase n=1 Tax=Petrotoga sp. 9PW.55.5.1 TaxID=1308979 RepID=UPI000DC3484B|nr:UDP-N-acetylmuramoyl-L-alanine--D-glutamate ligase [Petrotoga sp. 9PW.55.5.1]RAO98481.1 hypothetical protein PW5551_09470 [Petrotoga sp. 9PW.55.5.1]